jgi:hypothetical protein
MMFALLLLPSYVAKAYDMDDRNGSISYTNASDWAWLPFQATDAHNGTLWVQPPARLLGLLLIDRCRTSMSGDADFRSLIDEKWREHLLYNE